MSTPDLHNTDKNPSKFDDKAKNQAMQESECQNQDLKERLSLS